VDSETIWKTMATLEAEAVKGWRLSVLDAFGRRMYSSPVIPEPITITIEHEIAAGIGQDFTTGGRITIEGSDLLAPHLDRGHIGLELWTSVGTPPKYGWWVFPCVIRGRLYQSTNWDRGPDGDLPIEADSMWQFIATEARPEFAEQPK
jgi:hypothetical protein